jgi:hypothetical protein
MVCALWGGCCFLGRWGTAASKRHASERLAALASGAGREMRLSSSQPFHDSDLAAKFLTPAGQFRTLRHEVLLRGA